MKLSITLLLALLLSGSLWADPFDARLSTPTGLSGVSSKQFYKFQAAIGGSDHLVTVREALVVYSGDDAEMSRLVVIWMKEGNGRLGNELIDLLRKLAAESMKKRDGNEPYLSQAADRIRTQLGSSSNDIGVETTTIITAVLRMQF